MREIFTNAYWTENNKPKPKTKLQQEIDDKIFGKSPIKFTSTRTVAEIVIKILEEKIDEEIKKYPILENYSSVSARSCDDCRVDALNKLKEELFK